MQEGVFPNHFFRVDPICRTDSHAEENYPDFEEEHPDGS